MQLRTENSVLKIGNSGQPAISLAISPKSRTSHLMTGLVVGTLLGFVVGSVATLLVGEKSLLLVQHLWNRVTGVNDNGDKVHFELLLQ
jgi:hypothetical protein